MVVWTGDIKKILNDFIDFDLSKKSWDSEVFSARKKEMFSNFVPKKRSLGPLAIIHDLRKILPEEGILAVDVGAHLHLIGQMWTTPAPEKLLMTNGWSSMGFAIPAAMAAKLCNQEIPVVALMGDGGFLMTVGELATAKRLNLKIIFVVIYDNSLSLIRIKQGKKNYNNSYGTQLEKQTFILDYLVLG